MRRAVLCLCAAALLGCSPRTREDCMRDAAGKPTEYGARLAAAQCLKEFPDR